MSKTFSPRENASPLVRSTNTSSSTLDQGDHFDSLAHHVDPTFIPPPPPLPSSTLKSFAPQSHANPTSQQAPQLSERDSIFATNYSCSDSNNHTSGSPTTNISKIEFAHDVASDFSLPPSLLPEAGIPTSSSSSTRSPPSIMSPNTASHFHYFKLKRSTTSPRYNEQFTSSPYQDTSSGGAKLDSSDPPTLSESQDTTFPRPSRSQRSQTTFRLRVSAPWNPMPKQDQPSELFERNKLETTRIKQPKNLKETGNHEEANQQIEATIASDEPAPHGRSRKASHYLGIFKENTNSQEQRKSKEKQKDPEFDRITDPPDVRDSKAMLEAEPTDQTQGQATTPEEVTPDRQDDISSAIQYPVPPVLTRSSSQTTGPPTSLFSQRSSMADTDDDSLSYVSDSIEWRSPDSERGLPLRLLEDIRNYRAPKRPLSKISRIENKTSNSGGLINRSHQSSPSRSELGQDSSSSRPDTEEEEYSDKDYISSAVYYPHQAPSPDTISQHHHLEESELEHDKVVLDFQPLAGQVDEKTTETSHSSKVVSRNLSRDQLYHSNQSIDNFGRSLTTSEADHTWNTSLYPSETEDESGYDTTRSERGSESGLTDGGEMTPTATPSVRSNVQSRTNQPLKAVQLKPYKHQVGGHTKVFSFSRQAICKQLNNRENVFYEVIERKHPELLEFLPK
jgi:inositol-hexakisphosphate 5-kinase